MFKYRTQVVLLAIVCLVSACQSPTIPDETAGPTSMPTMAATEVSTRTPTASPASPPTSTVTPVTPDVIPGQVTPDAGPSDDEILAGWVLTDMGILRTIDGGKSWEDVTPPGMREAISSASGSAGSAATLSGSGFGLAAVPQEGRVMVYRTSDGGQHWEEAELILNEEVQGITSIAILEEQHAWLLATRGVGAGNDWVDLYYTEDGGASWSFLAGSDSENNPAGGISSGGIKTGLVFSSLERGWLTGSAPIDMVYLFRTVDGGLTWQPYHLPLPENASFSGSSEPPIFFDEQNGVLPASVITQADEAALLFYRTQDGGDSWEPAVMLEGQVNAWDWLNPLHGFAAGTDDQSQTKIFVTQDGGASWEAYLVSMAVVSEMDFISELQGWAICGWAFDPRENCSEDIYHTQDGGRSWEKVYP